MLLSVKNLSVVFYSRGNATAAVRSISFDLQAGEILAIVGESGSGKSVSSQALTSLLPEAPACKVSGSVTLLGRELIGLRERDLQKIRGKEIAYIFQNPQSSLNPVYTVGWQLEEVLKIHLAQKFPSARLRRERVSDLLLSVGLKPEHASAYPFELSGGMQQRAMIAMALAAEPRILVADEPTTALDVTVQAQIMDLLLDLRERLGMSILLITHNFGLVAKVADRVCVMYRGDLVETGTAKSVIAFPQNDYTRRLLAAVPRL
ncbi:MAG: ABC transporter ATP-binding protein [Opitutales bacterium]|nr:ABC transporter ATP-binding protein [Opitutales bacterium]